MDWIRVLFEAFNEERKDKSEEFDDAVFHLTTAVVTVLSTYAMRRAVRKRGGNALAAYAISQGLTMAYVIARSLEHNGLEIKRLRKQLANREAKRS